MTVVIKVANVFDRNKSLRRKGHPDQLKEGLELFCRQLSLALCVKMCVRVCVYARRSERGTRAYDDTKTNSFPPFLSVDAHTK